MAVVFEAMCVLLILLVLTVLHLVKLEKDKRDKKGADKKEKGPAGKDDKVTSPDFAALNTNRPAALPTQDRSVSPINVSSTTLGRRDGPLSSSSAASADSQDPKCLSPSRSATLSLSNVSELRVFTISDLSKSVAQSASKQNLGSVRCQLLSKPPAEGDIAQSTQHQGSTYTEKDERKNEHIEPRSEEATEVAMDARQRRRLFDKTADVSPADTPNWRSRVYQTENTNTSNSSYLTERRHSYRTKEAVSSADILASDADLSKESRRRRSEGYTGGDLSERLAKRRAKRLEEQQESISQDGSFEHARDRDRQWSRDGSIRSVNSVERCELEDKFSSRQSNGHEADFSSSVTHDAFKGSRRGNRDSIMSTENIENNEELHENSYTHWNSLRDCEGSHREQAELVGQKWGSKDSNFVSADSTCSFRSHDSDSSDTKRPGHSSLGQDSSEHEYGDYSGRRRRMMYQDPSKEDSAFSEKSEDTMNMNNNNDAEVLPHADAVTSSWLRKHRVEDSIDESEELNESASYNLESSISHISENSGTISTINDRFVQSGAVIHTHLETLESTKPTREGGGTSDDSRGCHGGVELAIVTTQAVSEDLEVVKKRSEELDGTDIVPKEHFHRAQENPDNPNEKPSSFKKSEVPKRRKSRKNKTSVRKSKLNMADDSSTEDMSFEGSSQLGQDQGQSDEKPRRKAEGSFVSQHASFWENHAPNIQNATPTRERINIPSRYTGDKEKLTATRQKFMQDASASTETTSTPAPKLKSETVEDTGVKNIVRGRTDFNQLLQKFSGSESNSEKSDTDAGSSTVSAIPRRRSLVKRQEAKEVLTSSGESDTRRTPDRTQSLKLPSRRDNVQPADISEITSGSTTTTPAASSTVEKCSNFRSEFMNRQFSLNSADTSHNQLEPSSLQTFGSSSVVDKTHLETKMVAPSSVIVSDNEKHGASARSSANVLSRFASSQKQPEKTTSKQNQPQELKPLSNRGSTESAQNLTKNAITSNEEKYVQEKAKGTNTGSLASKHSEPVNMNTSSSLSAKSSSGTETRHSLPETTGTSKPNTLLPSTDTSKHREHPRAQARSSLERDTTPAAPLSTNTTSLEIVPVLSEKTGSNLSKTPRASTDSARHNEHLQEKPRSLVELDVKPTTPLSGITTTSLDTASNLMELTGVDMSKTSQARSSLERDSMSEKPLPTTITSSLEIVHKLSENTGTTSSTHKSQIDSAQRIEHSQTQPRSSLQRDVKPAAPLSTTTTSSLDTTSTLKEVTGTNLLKTSTNSAQHTDHPRAKVRSALERDAMSEISLSATTAPSLEAAQKHFDNVGTNLSKTPKSQIDTAHHTEHPRAKVRSSLEREVTSATPVASTTTSSVETPSKLCDEIETNPSKTPKTSVYSAHHTDNPQAKTRSSLERNVMSAAPLSTTTIPAVDSLPESLEKTDSYLSKIHKNSADSTQHTEQPLAKPMVLLENNITPATTPSSIATAPNVSASPVLSTLPLSVSSSEIKSVADSPEVALSGTSDIRRASSFKEVSINRTDSLDKRKGILKRNTSLTKHDVSENSSSPLIDPQLAKILMQRKQIVGDASAKDETEEKKSEEVRRTRPLSATEEIEETLRYSQQKAAERGLNPDQDEGLKRISVAERIYSMQNKIEEEKFAAVISRSRSGLSTPRSRPRSGLMTPTSQKSVDETANQQISMSSSGRAVIDSPTSISGRSNNTSVTQQPEQQQSSDNTAVSGSQLMEKLSKIAKATEKYEEKRHRFQHRTRKDWRYQTQPVTLDEIHAADSLETVSAFRALVRKQSSFNAFEQIKAEATRVIKQGSALSGKKAEFPEHLAPPSKLSRRSRKLRHRTLPVTAEELNAVPEHQMLLTDPDWIKFDEYSKRDSKADSGILSGSDADSLYQADSLRSLTMEMDVSDSDPSRMSVTDKASMFRVLEEKTRAEKDKEKSASGAKRYINRKKRERSQTMPITDEEVKSASEMGESRSITSPSRNIPVNVQQPEVVNRSRSSSISECGDTQQPEDELTKLSLIEKVKLFSQPRDVEKPPAKIEAPVIRRRNRKVASRFNTQPVTTEEVEKAAACSRISPLAMSMVKPPDPEILKTLPLKDQRELMAQHAEMFLSQNSLRSRSGSNASQSQPSSRRASITLEEDGAKKSEDDVSEKNGRKGILKDKSASAKDLHDVKSILKTEPVKAKSESEVHSILKADVKQILESGLVSPEPRGILKKTRSEDTGGLECNEDIKGILKHPDSDEEEYQGKPRSRSNSQPLGILKLENISQVFDHALERKSILKAPSQENVHEPPVMKSALRRGSLETDTGGVAASGLKSALRMRNKNSLELEDTHTSATSDLSSTGQDLNSNNSNKHVGITMSMSAQQIDHFSSSTNTRQVSTTLSSIRAFGSADVKTTVDTSSSFVTTTATSISTLQVPGGSEDKSGLSASDDGESSSGEILEDTPRTTKLKRKSRFSDKAAKAERYKTQPPELTESTSATNTPADTTTRRKFKYEGRHRTQPITPDEMREAEASTPETNLTHTPGGSIADRLNQLKTSGEEEWKKRVGRKDELLATSPDIIKLREKTTVSNQRPFSIADRLNEMQTSMTTWKERVEESDAKQFTVAGKLAHGPTDSPLINKLKSLPRKDGEPGSKNSTPLSSPVTPTKEFIAKIPLPKDIVQDTSVSIESLRKGGSGDGAGDEAEVKREPVKVEIPDMGQEVENFFAVKPIEEIKDKVKIEVEDFNDIFIEAEMILSTVRKARPVRKTRPSSHNPLKTMSQKLEIRQEYTEILYGTAEKELKRVKKEALAKDAGFAQAALAGLASKENFKQVELRRTDSGSSVHGQALDPFKDLMVLHVKGRRSVQTRLVEPHTRSINEGDCYILVTADKVVYWEGQYANVIEKAKASEIANYIQQKKDLGCKKANEVSIVQQVRDNLGAGKHFWAALEGEKQIQACGPDTEDELYENSVVKCNMIYRLEGNALQPYREYWGAIPKYDMLKKHEVIIFDFGTEFYIWQGKAVTMEQRKLALKLSKQLYEKGYDYTESAINPFSPLRTEDNDGLPLNSASRPKWAIFGKINQNMETILFREKFSDWPDSSRLIGVKSHGPVEAVSKELLELKAFDAKKMIPMNTTPVNQKLDGANLGRGVKWSEDMQGFVKEQDIITLEVTVWHVLEYEHYILPALSHGQFHDGDTYVVRWQYMISNANLRNLKGNATRNSMMGRERCAYFFWQGNQSTINEKGASALMTVELDEERGPQVRVLQGKEPPCFLNLFGGKMMLHIGKREDPATNTQGSWRLYCLRGDYENEIYLLEVPVFIQNLRSRSSMILLNIKTGIVYIWHGAKSPKHVRELCLKAVSRLKENTPLEIGLHKEATITVVEVEEGEEKREIWTALDKQDRIVYHSLLTDPRPQNHTIRLFSMSSVNLVFEVHEQLNPARVPDLTTPFPFLQSDLYKATQPALFLIDNDYEVYLWQGWWPVGSHDTENVHTGSAIARFNIDRKLAMETTLHYCREKNHTKPPTAYLVCAGVEPVRFTSLFPHWEEDTIVMDVAAEEGKTPGYIEQVSDILHRLTQTRYTLAELQERPLPEGVDPLKLESYLNDADFEEILEMSRDEFYSQPNWKQIDMKKHMGLF